MTDKTISLKLTSELLQKAEEIAGNGANLHDFLVTAIENGTLTRLHIPKALVEEWQQVAAKNPNFSPKLFPTFELIC